MNQVLIVGSVALDSIETPTGTVDNALGGAATYGSIAASYFAPVHLVGVVGEDFPAEHIAFLKGRSIDLEGLQVVSGGKTFRWKGDYIEDLNAAVTHETHLGVFEHFEPQLPESYRNAEFVFLANINPSLQARTLDQVTKPRFVLCDTMNLWINIARDDVKAIFGRVDMAVLNDGEAKMLSDESNLLRAARAIQKLGPKYVVIKKGEHGSLLLAGDEMFAAPAYPLEEVVDPTGAGDSFAGALMGHLAKTNDLSLENIKRAVVTGSVVASSTVQDFSTKALSALTPEEIERRLGVVRKISTF
jgi:sugar/nucleoside kinase (ribokinase family)